MHVLETLLTAATYNRPFRVGKGFLFEGGIRIPLIVRWPRNIKSDRTTDVPMISTDWTPTLLGLANIDVKEKFEGANRADLLPPGKAPPARPLYWHQPHYRLGHRDARNEHDRAKDKFHILVSCSIRGTNGKWEGAAR